MLNERISSMYCTKLCEIQKYFFCIFFCTIMNTNYTKSILKQELYKQTSPNTLITKMQDKRDACKIPVIVLIVVLASLTLLYNQKGLKSMHKTSDNPGKVRRFTLKVCKRRISIQAVAVIRGPFHRSTGLCLFLHLYSSSDFGCPLLYEILI